MTPKPRETVCQWCGGAGKMGHHCSCTYVRRGSNEFLEHWLEVEDQCAELIARLEESQALAVQRAKERDVANARAEAAERERDAKEEELDVWRNEATPSQQRASKRIAVLEGALRNERSISHGRTTEPHIEGPSEECSNEKCVRLTAALSAPGTSGADDAALVPNPNCPECRGSGKYKTINSGDDVNGREQS